MSLKGDGVVEGIAPGSPAHVEACGSGEDPGVERGEGGGCLARIPPPPAPHAVGSLVPEVLSELLVEPGGVHQALTVGVQPLVALVEARVHLGPVQVLGHPCGSSNDGRPLVRPVSVLLHVLGQVGLLGVALAAVGADVGLQMLGLLVLGDVLQQRGLVVETLVAGVTFVWLVRLVTPGVGLQVRELGERLGASWVKQKRENS